MPVPYKKRKKYAKAYIRQHYKDNKQYYINKAAKRRTRINDYVKSLKNKPCVDCNTKYPCYVMDFDHLKDKKVNLSQAGSQGWSEERIDKEVTRCELVCANCHRERTHNKLSPIG